MEEKVSYRVLYHPLVAVDIEKLPGNIKERLKGAIELRLALSLDKENKSAADYLDTPAWHYNTDEITQDKFRTWGGWRGYGDDTGRCL